MKSPKIDSIEWGQIKVNEQTFKDVRLFPGGVEGWDWRKTDTHHRPGIQIADLEGLMDADIVVLSKGFKGCLCCMDETIKHLEDAGKIVYHEETKEAVETYNSFVENESKVSALIHSTC